MRRAPTGKQSTMFDFELAKDKVMMGAERKSMLLTEEEKRDTAYHEAGHALVAAMRDHADPLHKVTIIPRGMALGVTMQLPEDDKHTVTKDYLETQLAILMGGRCAEEIFMKQMTTGAGNDIERATELARKMVCEYGMSRLGPLTFGKKEEQIFLGREIAQHRDFSEETARQIDSRGPQPGGCGLPVGLQHPGDQNSRSCTGWRTALLDRETMDANEISMIIDGRGTAAAEPPLGPPPAAIPAVTSSSHQAGAGTGSGFRRRKPAFTGLKSHSGHQPNGRISSEMGPSSLACCGERKQKGLRSNATISAACAVLIVLLVALALLAFTGCGYHTLGLGRSYPGDGAHTRGTFFKNKTQFYHTEVTLTQAMVHELTRSHQSHCGRRDQATARCHCKGHRVLRIGTIVDLRTETTTCPAGQTTSVTSSYLITINVNVVVTDRDQRVLYQHNSYIFHQQYETTADLTRFIRKIPLPCRASPGLCAVPGERYSGVLLKCDIPGRSTWQSCAASPPRIASSPRSKAAAHPGPAAARLCSRRG